MTRIVVPHAIYTSISLCAFHLVSPANRKSGSWYQLRRLAFTRSWWGRGENQSLLFSIGRSLSPLLFEKLSNRLPEGWLIWCRVVVTFAFLGSCCWDRFSEAPRSFGQAGSSQRLSDYGTVLEPSEKELVADREKHGADEQSDQAKGDESADCSEKDNGDGNSDTPAEQKRL
jgi:hypothetical protein